MMDLPTNPSSDYWWWYKGKSTTPGFLQAPQ